MQGSPAKDPTPLVESVTVPVGIVGPVKAASVTTTVHVVAWLIVIEFSMHEIVVIVGSGGGVTAMLVPLVLDTCTASPPYTTVMMLEPAISGV